MLLSLFIGFGLGWLLFRVGFHSVYPLLLLLPLLFSESDAYWVIGLASASIIGLLHETPSSSHEDVVIALGVAMVGWLFALFFVGFFPLETSVFPVLMLITFWWLFNIPSPRFLSLAAVLFIFAGGWWLLHVHSFPLALSAFFSGWWSVSFLTSHTSYSFSRVQKIRDAVIGCVLGFLPGVGPGIAQSLWFSGRSSPVLVITNLIFSLGYFLLHGRVRSVFASSLVSFPAISVLSLIFSLALLLLFGIIFWNIFPHFYFSIPSFWVVFLLGVSFFFAGGFLPLLIWLLAFASRKLSDSFSLSPDLGSLILLPSIVWFYFPFF